MGYADDEAKQTAETIRRTVSIGIKVALGLFIFTLVMGSWFIVSPGEVAIKTRLGTLVGAYGEGIHFKLPWLEGTQTFSIQIERSDIKTEAFTVDTQQMTVDLAVNHRIQQDTIESIYRNLGPNYVETILNPMIQEILKAITAKYSAESIIANRMEMVKLLNEQAKAKALEKEIIITDISVVDLAFKDAFMRAVEEKQVAVQQSKQAEKLVEKAKMEAEQMIATARGNAESLRLQKEQITPMMLENKRLDITREALSKWKGEVPTFMGGNTPVPFIDATLKGLNK